MIPQEIFCLLTEIIEVVEDGFILLSRNRMADLASW